MVWALPATMLRPYKQFEDHLNTICIPCVLETLNPFLYHFGSPNPVRDMHFVNLGSITLYRAVNQRHPHR